jgi:hypothetical protein
MKCSVNKTSFALLSERGGGKGGGVLNVFGNRKLPNGSRKSATTPMNDRLKETMMMLIDICGPA